MNGMFGEVGMFPTDDSARLNGLRFPPHTRQVTQDALIERDKVDGDESWGKVFTLPREEATEKLGILNPDPMRKIIDSAIDL